MSREGVSLEDTICVGETTDAIECEIGGEKFWFPKSTVLENSEVHGEGDEGTLLVMEWIATEKGLT